MPVATFEFLGTGTSQGVPIIGCDCAVCMSDDPNDKRLRSAAYIKNELGGLNIDIGTDFRQQMLRAGYDDTNAVLVTHEHIDHINGLDDVRPINYLKNKVIPVYAEDRVLEQIKNRFHYIFNYSPYPGLPQIALKKISPDDDLILNGMNIQILRVMHGELPILGFKIGDLAYLTDVKTLPERTMQLLVNVKTLIISSLHHRKHHSHMNYAESIALSARFPASTVYFTHCSHQMGKYKDICAQLPENIFFAYDGLKIDINY